MKLLFLSTRVSVPAIGYECLPPSSVRLAAIALLSKIANDETSQTLLNYEKSEVDVAVRAEVFKQLSQTRLLANHLE